VVAEGIHFNVSHSGDLILLGVSDARSVGIDVERRRDVRRVQQLIDRWLTDDERDDLSRHVADGTSPSDAFLKVWSLKEARLKALGVGVSGSGGAALDRVDAVALDDLLDSLASSGDALGYVGALAFADGS